MTLCIAWKQNNDIFFASDSRLTRKNGDNYLTTSNTAPKIFSIPIRVYGTESETELLYDKDWGFCLAGGYISGSGYADTLSEILSNLQIAEGVSNVDHRHILNIAFSIYEQISKQLVENGDKEALAKILITGICPSDLNRNFLFEFGYDYSSDGINYYSNEIDLSSVQTYFIGDKDAIHFFKERLKETPSINFFHLLKEVCKKPELETVGGFLQSGVLRHTNPKHFSILGILESELELEDDIRWTVKDHWYFRSIELKPELFEGYIHVRKMFLMPFDKKRNELFDEANERTERELTKKMEKK